jgi:septal ring factor EnvC (AmiA/AmiB activator)
MRRSLLLPLALAGIAAADDSFAEHLRVFDEARKVTLQAGAQARVNPALEALVGTGDIRAAGPVASYLLETVTNERRLTEDGKKLQKEISESSSRAETLAAELKRLELKEKAGDRTIGPEIERCAAERAQCLARCDQIMKAYEQLDRTTTFLRGLRDRLADACTALLKGRKGAEATAGIEAVRRPLDPADREQGLLLVRILASSGIEGVEEQLLDIVSAPKADAAVRLRAQYGLANHLTRRGAESLLRAWEDEPENERPRHILSVAAKKRLETIEDARTWVATLP